MGEITPENYTKHVHEVTNPRNMIIVTACLKDELKDTHVNAMAALEYTCIPREQRLKLPFEPWVMSPVEPKTYGFIQYAPQRMGVAACRLNPSGGIWHFCVRELVSEEMTLEEAKL